MAPTDALLLPDKSRMQVRWGQLSAVGSLAVVPIMIASVLASKRIIAGMTRGSVK